VSCSGLGAVGSITEAQELECFIQSISNIAAYNNINYDDFLALQLDVLWLLKHSQKSGSGDLVKNLCKKYAWALRPLSILFATVIAVE
jgi:hypothetical protein